MNVDRLIPEPRFREVFRLDRARFIPATGGCYVLATIDGVILYVGQSVDLRKRMTQHLENPEKVKPTKDGRAFYFYWMETANLDVLERTWMNCHSVEHGKLPILNGAYSPIRI